MGRWGKAQAPSKENPTPDYVRVPSKEATALPSDGQRVSYLGADYVVLEHNAEIGEALLKRDGA